MQIIESNVWEKTNIHVAHNDNMGNIPVEWLSIQPGHKVVPPLREEGVKRRCEGVAHLLECEYRRRRRLTMGRLNRPLPPLDRVVPPEAEIELHRLVQLRQNPGQSILELQVVGIGAGEVRRTGELRREEVVRNDANVARRRRRGGRHGGCVERGCRRWL